MITKGQKKGTVKFSVRPPNGATKVELAGDFNGWKPQPMRKQKNGHFTCVVPVAPGAHEYKFVLDGQWSVDPDNSSYSLNPYGTLNSVTTVS